MTSTRWHGRGRADRRPHRQYPRGALRVRAVSGRRCGRRRATDADRFLAYLRPEGGRVARVQQGRPLAAFFDFLIARYQGEIHALTGVRRRAADRRVQPAGQPDYGDVAGSARPRRRSTQLFAAWRDVGCRGPQVPAGGARLPGGVAVAAGWVCGSTRRVMLDIRDWRPDLGEHGKLHVRFGKGSRGRGPKPRLVPAINSVDALLDWWLADVRHQFGDDCADPDAPLLPSERRDRDTGPLPRVGDRARCAPAWPARSTAGCRPGGAADPARPAALLRLLALRPGGGPQGHPGTARPRVAVHHDPLHPRPRRPHRAGLDQRPTSASPRASAREG